MSGDPFRYMNAARQARLKASADYVKRASRVIACAAAALLAIFVLLRPGILVSEAVIASMTDGQAGFRKMCKYFSTSLKSVQFVEQRATSEEAKADHCPPHLL